MLVGAHALVMSKASRRERDAYVDAQIAQQHGTRMVLLWIAIVVIAIYVGAILVQHFWPPS